VNFFRTHTFEICIVLLAIVVRFAYLGVAVTAHEGNFLQTVWGADGYYDVTKNLIEGNGLSSSQTPPYEPYSFRPPLYHLFILGSYQFGGYEAVIALQILLGSLVPIIGMCLARYFTQRREVLGALGLFLAVEPSGVLYSTILYSETLFTVLFLGALWAFFEYLRRNTLNLLAFSGVLLGLATLTRPTSQYVPLVFLAVFIWRRWGRLLARETWVPILMYSAIFIAILSPWAMRNYLVFGVWGLSPQTGVNLYTTLLPTVYSIDKGTTFQEEYAAQRAAGIPGPNQAAITDGSREASLAIPELLSRPRALVYSALNSAWSFFVLDGGYDYFRQIDVRPKEVIGKPSVIALFTDPGAVVSYLWRNIASVVSVILVLRLLWFGITVAFAVGAWRALRAWSDPYKVTAVLVVLYFMLTSLITGFGLTARYRLPVNSLVIAVALTEVAMLAPWVRSKDVTYA
jgi:hypothetical protein